MIKKLTYFIIILMINISAFAQDHQETIQLANKDYADGLYNNAIAKYHQILDEGYSSADLYYNLANAYFRNKDIASAILYYEKAKKIKPNDADIIHNLSVSNSRITDKIESLPVIFYKRWWNNLKDMFSYDAWTQIHLISLAIFLFLILGYFIFRKILLKKVSFWIGLLFLLIALFTFGMSYQKYTSVTTEVEAIIFSPSITIKSSPTDNSIDLFVIHEGTKVRIIDELDNWYEIRIASGSSGWIQAGAVKRI